MVMFQTSDNILEWSPSLFQNRPDSEIFCYVRKVKGEKLNAIESELDAIERVKTLREVHQELGIKKPDNFYKYAKLAFMELNDTGLTVTEEHLFRDTEGEVLFISYN